MTILTMPILHLRNQVDKAYTIHQSLKVGTKQLDLISTLFSTGLTKPRDRALVSRKTIISQR